MVKSASVSVVDVLTDGQLAALKSLGTPVRYPEEHTIFWEGQPSHAVLVIDEGYVKVTRVATDGTEVILAIRGPKYIMGDEGVLMDQVRSATVTTITEVAGVDVKAEALLRFVNDQQLWPVMYREAVRRRCESEVGVILSRLGVKSRLAFWLLQLAAEVGEQVDDGWAIATTLSQKDLAGHIGASRDAVAIELRRLREKGLVTTGRHRIVLHDLDELRRISSGTS